MEIIISVFVIIGIVIVTSLIVKKSHNVNGNKVELGNVIKSIQINGICGINIGDEWKFLLNRLLHIGMITQEEFYKYHDECFDMEYNDGYYDGIVNNLITKEVHQYNIDRFMFIINEGKLVSIFVYINRNLKLDDIIDFLDCRFGVHQTSKCSDGSQTYVYTKEDYHLNLGYDKQNYIILIDNTQK